VKPDIQLMHKLWDGVKLEDKSSLRFSKVNFDEIISSIFTSGPFYYYIIDFFNMSISNLSQGFQDAHGIQTERVKTVNDILSLIHKDDMSFVSKAEEKALAFVFEIIGAEKFNKYKGSYNFRLKTADGSYQLFNHQALVLTMDENCKFIKSLNIHTNISHLTKMNNYKFSLIGLAGEPSYLNMEVNDIPPGTAVNPVAENIFTKREIEIIKLLAEGRSTKSIAEKLFISPTTAETHRKNILRKSGCDNSVMLVARSISEGWI
jgi:DNA-binding CsgD family transcriptional regulator